MRQMPGQPERASVASGEAVSDLASDEVGTPQCGPLGLFLANLLLDEVDQALEARYYSFSRYADDCNVYLGSKRAAERVMA